VWWAVGSEWDTMDLIGRAGDQRVVEEERSRKFSFEGHVVDQDKVIEEEVMNEIFGDHVKWKGMMRTLFSSHMSRRRGDRKFLIWVGRKVCLLCRVKYGWMGGLGKNRGSHTLLNL
jgi:hypothetical protein